MPKLPGYASPTHHRMPDGVEAVLVMMSTLPR